MLVGRETRQYAYQNTAEGSPLRLYVSSQVVYRRSPQQIEHLFRTRLEDYPKEMLADMVILGLKKDGVWKREHVDISKYEVSED